MDHLSKISSIQWLTNRENSILQKLSKPKKHLWLSMPGGRKPTPSPLKPKTHRLTTRSQHPTPQLASEIRKTTLKHTRTHFQHMQTSKI